MNNSKEFNREKLIDVVVSDESFAFSISIFLDKLPERKLHMKNIQEIYECCSLLITNVSSSKSGDMDLNLLHFYEPFDIFKMINGNDLEEIVDLINYNL